MADYERKFSVSVARNAGVPPASCLIFWPAGRRRSRGRAARINIRNQRREFADDSFISGSYAEWVAQNK